MKKRKILPLLLITAVLTAGTAAFILKPSLRYMAKDILAGLFRTNTLTEIVAEELTLKTYTLDELLENENVTYNQSMLLINSEYPLTSDFAAETGEYNDSGVIMNTCVMEAYRSLAAEISEKFNEKLYIMSAYRTEAEQAAAMESEGEKAARLGESEHQAGLGLDVYFKYYAGAGFLDSEAGQYVNENCQNHGFIIRYPYYGKNSTGIGFEPWHLRYVGEPHAKIITENRLTLEEYMDKLGESGFWQYEDTILTIQNGEQFLLPAVYDTMTISPDNRGNYIFTVKIR